MPSPAGGRGRNNDRRAARQVQVYLRAVCNVRQTFSGVAGICTYGAPTRASASFTAFITADNAPTVPDSPAPFTPSGLVLVGTSFSPSSKLQKLSARGIA